MVKIKKLVSIFGVALALSHCDMMRADAGDKTAKDKSAPDSATEEFPRQANIYRTPQAITIDGKRDEEAWKSAPSVEDFVFTWWKDGDGPKQQTDVKMLWDDENLYVSFVCVDHNVLATRTERDSDVYNDDCVEVFASPEIAHPENYFNLEMNAAGAWLDNYRPEGKDPDEPWNPDGIVLAVEIDGTINDPDDVDRGWSIEVAIPLRLFAHCLPQGHPRVGDQWRLNLNRLEDSMDCKSQWSMGDLDKPSFHQPHRFGTVTFQGSRPINP